MSERTQFVVISKVFSETETVEYIELIGDSLLKVKLNPERYIAGGGTLWQQDYSMDTANFENTAWYDPVSREWVPVKTTEDKDSMESSGFLDVIFNIIFKIWQEIARIIRRFS